MRKTLATLVAACTLTACLPTVGVPKAAKSPAAGGAIVTTEARPTLAPSPGVVPSPPPTATASVAPTAAPTASLLQAPKEASTLMAGTVTIDAGYTLAHGGTLLSGHGSGILAVGGLLSDQGGGLVSDHGGGIIANNSGNIIANNSGNLIANNGGGLTGKTKRHLLATAAPAPGATLPAAGMLVRATDLTTHQPIPVGVDGNNQPVYAIYTNLNGGFQVYLPASEQGNILLSAEVPGMDDARLSYQAVAPAKPTQALPINEDATVTTRYVREGLIGRMVQMMTDDPAATLCLLANSPNMSPTLKKLIASAVTDVHTAAVAAGITTGDNQNMAVWALAGRCADAIIAQTDLNAITLGKGNVTWGTEANEGPEPALDAVNEVLGAAREAAAKQMAANPTYFDSFLPLVDANACDPKRYQVLKPTDINSFMVDEYLSRTAPQAVKDAGRVVEALGAGLDPKGVSRLRRIRAAADAIAQALSQNFVLDTNGSRTQTLALVKAYQPTYQAIPGEPRPFVIKPSCILRDACVPDAPATP